MESRFGEPHQSSNDDFLPQIFCLTFVAHFDFVRRYLRSFAATTLSPIYSFVLFVYFVVELNRSAAILGLRVQLHCDRHF